MGAEADRSCFVSSSPTALNVTGNLQTDLTKNHLLNSKGRNFICERNKSNLLKTNQTTQFGVFLGFFTEAS